MKTIGMLVSAALLAACGGSKGGGEAKAPVPVHGDLGPDMNETYQAGLRDSSVQPMAGLRDPSVRPVPDEPLPVLLTAAAELVSMKDGSPIGTLTFEQGSDDRITISGELSGLGKDSVRAFYVHESGDCAVKGKKLVGDAGDFGNLTADADGKASFSVVTDSVTLASGRDGSLIHRSAVIHVGKDSKKGHGGDAFACGVIELVEGAD